MRYYHHSMKPLSLIRVKPDALKLFSVHIWWYHGNTTGISINMISKERASSYISVQVTLLLPMLMLNANAAKTEAANTYAIAAKANEWVREWVRELVR